MGRRNLFYQQFYILFIFRLVSDNIKKDRIKLEQWEIKNNNFLFEFVYVFKGGEIEERKERFSYIVSEENYYKLIVFVLKVFFSFCLV